jgi:hypothetical protein
MPDWPVLAIITVLSWAALAGLALLIVHGGSKRR